MRKHPSEQQTAAPTPAQPEDGVEDILAQSKVGPESETDTELDPAELLVELEQVKTELEEQKEMFLRAKAEAENIRRRAANDVTNARKFAVEGFASEALSVKDSLELARAIDVDDQDTGLVEKMKEGLDLTLKQLDSAFGKFGIQVIEPESGEKLNPELHQAMSTQESSQIAPNHIVSVIQKGYSIHDRLLRPAMVIVAKSPVAAD